MGSVNCDKEIAVCKQRKLSSPGSLPAFILVSDGRYSPPLISVKPLSTEDLNSYVVENIPGNIIELKDVSSAQAFVSENCSRRASLGFGLILFTSATEVPFVLQATAFYFRNNVAVGKKVVVIVIVMVLMLKLCLFCVCPLSLKWLTLLLLIF